MPAPLVTKNIWEERFQDICAFERYLSRNGFVIRKFFLNVSKKEQKKRFLDRLQQPEKNWKFSSADLHERERWDDYMNAYEEMIANTATPHAPWFVIPADNKWFTRLAVAASHRRYARRAGPVLSQGGSAEDKRNWQRQKKLLLRNKHS